jgi:putative transposase
MIKAYKYKIHPNAQQQELLGKFFGCCRYIYNWGLNRKSTAYKENRTKIGYNMLAKELTSLKQMQEYDWLNECLTESLQQSLRNLDAAFTRFFREKGKFPQFKSKRHSKDSAKFIQNVHFDFKDWRVKLPKLGWIELCENRAFNQSVCKQGTCTVSRDKCGTYWCSIVVEDNEPKPMKAKLVKETAVGIDLGIKDYAILSDGIKFTNPKHLEQAQRKLAWLQRDFARTQKDSKNHEKMRVKVAKCYRSITNQRNDFLHKLSTYLIQNYDTICLEDLNVNGMEQNHHLARSIQGAAWSEFVRQLEYKSDWYGKNVLFIGRFEPSSKTCSNCGYVNDDLKLSDRKWTCPNCGEHHDRDVNAAINIREMAFSKVLAVA